MDGEVVYLYSYDVAREIDLKRAEASLRKEEAGFLEVSYRNLTGGLVAIHVAMK